MIEKFENCPDCSKTLDQAEYDGQFCADCHTTAFGFQTPKTLAGIIALVEGQKRAIDAASGEFSHEDYRGWRDRHDAALHEAEVKLHEHGAKISADWRGASISLMRVRSTCTSGMYGALTNWLRAARAKLGKEAA